MSMSISETKSLPKTKLKESAFKKNASCARCSARSSKKPNAEIKNWLPCDKSKPKHVANKSKNKNRSVRLERQKSRPKNKENSVSKMQSSLSPKKAPMLLY